MSCPSGVSRFLSDDPEPVRAVTVELRHEPVLPLQIGLHGLAGVVRTLVGPFVDVGRRVEDILGRIAYGVYS
jgi:hypothetical protein